MIGVFQRALGVPDRRCDIAFFVMFRGGTVGVRSEFMQFGGFAVSLVQGISSLEASTIIFPVHEAHQSRKRREFGLFAMAAVDGINVALAQGAHHISAANPDRARDYISPSCHRH